MKGRIVVLSMIVLICGGWASPQPGEKTHDSAQRTVPCPTIYLHVPARNLLASRTRQTPPEYPPVAVEANIQGTVVVRVVLDQQGNVMDAASQAGNPVLTVAAVKAIRKWKYKPIGLNKGQAGAEGLVVLTFSLAGSPSVTDADPPELVDLMEINLSKKPVCFAGSVLEGRLIHRVDPNYPDMAKVARVQGDVVISVTIGKTGSVDRASVVSGPALLAEAALEAVKQWKYTPYVQDNKPIEVESTVTVRFRM